MDNTLRTDIKRLLEKGFSGSKIAKELGKNKQSTLKNIRIIKGVNKKPNSVIYIPKKYLKPKQVIRKSKIITRTTTQKAKKKQAKRKIKLTKQDIKNIKELILKGTPKYRILTTIGLSKEKLTLKEIKKQKKVIKQDRLKKVNKQFPDCNYNYTTRSHIGYKFIRNLKIDIFRSIPDELIVNAINTIHNKVESMNKKVKCTKRMHYITLNYVITLKSGEKQKSQISTSISGQNGLFSFKGALNQINNSIFTLIKIVNRSESSKEILLKKVTYVNYDFKSNILR